MRYGLVYENRQTHKTRMDLPKEEMVSKLRN